MHKLFKGFRSELINLKSSASQHCCITEQDLDQNQKNAIKMQKQINSIFIIDYIATLKENDTLIKILWGKVIDVDVYIDDNDIIDDL